MLKKMMIDGIDKLGLTLLEHQLEKLYQYLLLFKEKHNLLDLSAPKEDSSIITDHLLDSLTFFKLLDNNEMNTSSWVKPYLEGGKWVDLGTGGGMPGIPVRISMPELDLTLSEVKKKKIVFLNEVNDSLGLKLRIIDPSQEKIFQHYKGLMTRAFASTKEIVRESMQYLSLPALIIAYKGAKTTIDNELEGLYKDQSLMKLIKVSSKLLRVQVPMLDKERHLLLLQLEKANSGKS